MRKALSLIAMGAISRLVPHPVNAVPMGAISLYAGANLSRRWAWLVPVAAMVLSDVLLLSYDAAYGRPLMDPSRLLIYGAYALSTFLGLLARRPKVGPWLLPALSLVASIIFFLASNLGAWLIPEMNYPRNLAGLLMAYGAGLPFLHRTVLADLAGTAVLFGIGSLLERAKGVEPTPSPAVEPQATA